MAVKPSPLILTDDNFLLDRGGATFKTPFKNLAENVLNLVLEGGPGGDSLIELHDLLDVDTDLYIKTRDTSTGAPSSIASRTTDGVAFNSAFWLLQAVNGTVSDESTGGSAKEQFVLADAKELFAEIAGDIGNALNKLELNSLQDVTTRVGGAVDGQFLSHVAGDSILLCVKEADLAVGGLPDYQPRSLKGAVNSLIDLNFDGIEIEIENLVDVNPIFILGGPLDDPTPFAVRLEVNDDYKNGIPNAKKYLPHNDPKQFDDILVYLTGTATDDVDLSTLDIAGNDLIDANGDEVTEITGLPEGWYYAENISDGQGKLEPAGLANADIIPETVGYNVTLGGVRVLKYKDTTLEDDGELGGKKVANVGTTPSNIGITTDGVLYSEIPKTLTFGRTIDIIGAATDAGTGVTDVTKVRFAYIDNSDDGNQVPVEGPGALQSPETWTQTPPASLPAVGDFYVIQFVDELDTNGDAVVGGGKQLKATLKWNDSYPLGATQTPGPDLKVENGDIVAFGGTQWSIIGSVNTETIAQDLQDVTERGNTTDQGIQLLDGPASKGLVVGRLQNVEDGGTLEGAVPDAGVIATKEIRVNEINFDYIRDLADA